MTLATLSDWALEMLHNGRVGRLGFVDADGRPRVLPITYAVVDGDIWSAIDSKPKRTGEPARVRWLHERPEAALVVDHYTDEWDELAWVQVLGTVEIVDAGQRRDVLEALTAKYPQYRAQPPPGPLLRLQAHRALCWRAADEVP